MKGPRVVIAEDDGIIRYTLARLVERCCEIVAEAGDGVEAIEAVDRLRPDIVLLDISMPRLNGFGAAARIKELAPTVKVIFVSAHTENTYLEEAQRVGAAAYVVKGRAATDLLPAIEQVAKAA